MSSLQKSFAKAKLANLPFDPPLPPGTSTELLDSEGIEEEDEDQEDELRPLPATIGSPEGGEDDSSSASSASSTGSTNTIRPEPRKKLFARPRGSGTGNSRSHYAPLEWTDYFEKELYLDSPEKSMRYHVYLSAPATSEAPLFVFHHGAGSSGLSFAACAAEMRKQAREIGLLCIDARGHGETRISEPGAEIAGIELKSADEQRMARALGQDKHGAFDLSLQTLAGDLETAVELTVKNEGWSEMPNLLLVGHSLGGAVVTHVAKGAKFGNKVLGYVVLDVVEGSAMDALQSMQTYLSSRPKSFSSVESAIEWHTRTRTIRTLHSARISVPSLLKVVTSSTPTSPVSEPVSLSPFDPVTKIPTPSSTNAAPSATDNSSAPPTVTPHWTWRTDLAATAPFWEDWFVGLSSKFLSARGGKLLLLAGTDRLDKELMIGQMQGKYQLQVYPEAGHFIQEDLPERTATALVDFWRRNDGRLVLPPKMSAMMKKASGMGAG